MRTEKEIKEEIESHRKHIDSIDYQFDHFAGIAEADSQSWINALKWVLEESEEE